MQQWETLIGLLEADIFSIRSALARAAEPFIVGNPPVFT